MKKDNNVKKSDKKVVEREKHFSELCGYSAGEYEQRLVFERKGVDMWEECAYEHYSAGMVIGGDAPCR